MMMMILVANLESVPPPWVTTLGWSFYTSQFTAGAARWSMVHFAQLTLSLDWHLGNMASSSGGTLLQVLAGPGVVMLMNIGIYLNTFLHGKDSISK